MATMVHKLPWIPHLPRGCAGCFEDGVSSKADARADTLEHAPDHRPSAPAPAPATTRDEGPAWIGLEPHFSVLVGSEVVLRAIAGPPGGTFAWLAVPPAAAVVGGTSAETLRLRGVRAGKVPVACVYTHPRAGAATAAATVTVEDFTLAWVGAAASDRRQFVNDDDSRAGADAGDTVELVCRITPPRAGVAVAFSLEEIEVSCPGRAHVTPKVGRTVERGEVVASLVLSTHGGDRFRVGAFLADRDETTVVASGEIAVWRRLYYQVTEMERPKGGGRYELPAAALAAAQAAFFPAFIRLEDAGGRNTAPYAMDAWADKETRIRPKMTRDWRVPLKLHFFVCDLAVLRQDSKWTTRVVAPVTPHLADDGAEVWWIPYRCERPGLESVPVAQWRRDDGSPWAFLPPGVLHADADGSGFVRLRLDFRGLPDPPSSVRPAWVRVHYAQAQDIGGLQNDTIGSSIAVCRGYVERTGESVDALLARIVPHESGHALDLVTARVNTFDGVAHCAEPSCLMQPGVTAASGRHFHHGARGCERWLRELDLSRDGPRAAVLGG